MSHPGSKPYYKRRFNHNEKHRKNERIRVPKVRVIGPDGKQLGVIPTKEALQMACQVGLDLVEVSPSASPPVCRILDYGKFLYDEGKKSSGKKNQSTKVKEIKLRINIDTHDYETKMRRAEKFLEDGYKVKVTLFFRGREMERQEYGKEVIQKALEDLSGMGSPDAPPRMVGRNLSVTFFPLPEGKRTPKFIEA